MAQAMITRRGGGAPIPQEITAGDQVIGFYSSAEAKFVGTAPKRFYQVKMHKSGIYRCKFMGCTNNSGMTITLSLQKNGVTVAGGEMSLAGSSGNTSVQYKAIDLQVLPGETISLYGYINGSNIVTGYAQYLAICVNAESIQKEVDKILEPIA